MVQDGKTVSVLHPHSTVNASATDARKLVYNGVIKGQQDSTGEPEFYSYERELTKDEIKTKWSRKGMVASHMGTEAHYQAELMFNGLPFRHWEPESGVLIDFARDFMVPKGLVTHATEKEIVCVDADVAGSLDAILFDPNTKLYHIVDHKRTDKLRKDLRGYGKMQPPFNHLDDCKGAAYALQTSIYQYILERDYGMEIGDRVLISLHPDNSFSTTVPYLKAEVEYIMNRRFALVKARRSVCEADARFRCSLTGAPANDAVLLSEAGKVAMEKAALVRGLPYTPCAELRREFEERVSAILEPVELDKSGVLAWWKRMPASGIVPFS